MPHFKPRDERIYQLIWEDVKGRFRSVAKPTLVTDIPPETAVISTPAPVISAIDVPQAPKSDQVIKQSVVKRIDYITLVEFDNARQKISDLLARERRTWKAFVDSLFSTSSKKPIRRTPGNPTAETDSVAGVVQSVANRSPPCIFGFAGTF
jgi:hypothetical protein